MSIEPVEVGHPLLPIPLSYEPRSVTLVAPPADYVVSPLAIAVLLAWDEDDAEDDD
ncbi:MAG: hypothetical protein ABSD13_00610 [Candidatus Korobacteraceae bacterium]